MGGRGSGNPTTTRRSGSGKMLDPANVDTGVNSKVTAMGKALMEFERPDLSDAEAIKQAFFKYLELCDEIGVKPLLMGVSNALGLGWHDLPCIAHNDPRYVNYRGGILTPECREILAKIYDFLSTTWETYLAEERGNPVKWLFFGKNYFGMKDQAEPMQVNLELKLPSRTEDDVMAEYAAMVGRPKQQRLPAVEIEAEIEDE